jgi:hypothetical protein
VTNLNTFIDQLNIDELEVQSETYPNRGNLEGRRFARFHVAIKYLLNAYELTSEEISDQVLTDWNDQGIDFFYKTEDDSPVVYVVQVKDDQEYAKAKQLDAITKMKKEIDFLLSRQRVSSDWSEKKKERYSDLKEIRNATFRIRYVLLLTGGASASISTDDFSSDWFDESERTLSVFDRNGIAELLQHANSPRSLNTQLTLTLSKAGVQPELNGSPKFLFGLITVSDYVKATENLGTDLFSLNPRLFLSSSSGPNYKMLETLNSPVERKNFHLFNNGITAVCKKFAIEHGDISRAKVEGLLVVNGCQTTETLWKWAKNIDNRESAQNTSVMIRVIETVDDEELARKISQTTNAQTSILSSDLVANDEYQTRLKTALESATSNPFFYENRRGSYKKLTATKKETFKIGPNDQDGKGYRTISLREMAQVLQSVTGMPEQAKEGISTLFKSENARYRTIFFESWEDAEQVLLVADLFKFVCKKSLWISDRADELEVALASLGRFYITHLIYETWRGGGRPNFDLESNAYSKLIDADASRLLRQNLVEEVGGLAMKATRSLAKVKKSHSIDGNRALLRQSEHKEAIREKFVDLVLDGE